MQYLICHTHASSKATYGKKYAIYAKNSHTTIITDDNGDKHKVSNHVLPHYFSTEAEWRQKQIDKILNNE